MSTEIGRFAQFAAENPIVISECLRKNFGVDALMGLSRENGFEISQDDVDECLGMKNPVPSEIRFLARASDGTLRELTREESDAVGGGIPISWNTAIAFVHFGAVAETVAVLLALAVVSLGVAVFIYE